MSENNHPFPGEPNNPEGADPGVFGPGDFACPLPAQQQATIRLAEYLLQEAEEGRVVSICYVAETIDNSYEHGCTPASEDRFGRFGYMIYVGLKLLGITSKFDDEGFR